MPSLSELQKFKASFQDIGREKADLAAKKIPLNDMELPDSEPEPLVTAAPPEAEHPADPVDDMDFSAFLGTQPEDLPEPPAPIIPESEEAQEAASDLYAPEELLSNLSNELDSIPPDFEEPSLNQMSAEGSDSGLDLDSLDNFDFPDEPVPSSNENGAEITGEDIPPLDLDSLDNFDLPDESVATDSGTSGFDNLDNFNMPDDSSLPEDTTAADEPITDVSAPAGGSENFDLESFDDLGFPDDSSSSEGTAAADEPIMAESAPAAEGENLDLGSFDDLGFPDDSSSPEGTAAADEPITDESAPAAEGENLDLGSFDDLGFPDDSSSPEGTAAADEPIMAESAPAAEGENLDLGSFDDLGFPDDSSSPEGTAAADEPISDESAPAGEGENLDLGSFDDLGFSDDSSSPEGTAAADEPITDESAPAGEDESLDLDGGFSAENFDASGPADESQNIDLGDFDDFDFSAQSDSADVSDINLGFPADSGPAESDSTDDFSFDALDDVLKKSHKEKTASPLQKPEKKDKLLGKAKTKAKKINIESLPDNVDEIQLSDDEFEGILETLSRYPLNLRIACEEIIAEQTVDAKLLAELIEHLVWGASAKETAAVAGRILGRTITVPKAFEKSTGAALEAEQASFAYIFVHNFLPVLRVFIFIAAVLASLSYLVYKFVYVPYEAEKLYKQGYERIFAGEYERANEHFTEAFNRHRKKDWFYKYAEAFRDERQYIYAERKYDELLRYYIRDKKGVLDYAYLETYYLRNYAKADSLLRNQLLDYAPNDFEGLLAAGDNCLFWGEIEPSRYEDARYYYARVMDKYGWQVPVVERMMKYFIRTDNLKETLNIKNWFDRDPVKRKLSADSLGELGGYLLDKQLEEVKGVPNEYVEYIDGVRDLLLEAVYADAALPEPHYHLARYYNNLGNTHEERVTLRIAVDRFEKAPEGSIRRLHYHIDALQRYADVLINAREFMPAEEQLIKGINLYEDGLSRRLLSPSPQYGRLYAGLGDLEYFTKTGDMEAALRYYRRSEQNGYAPPQMQYRMGAAYYQLEDWKNALEYLFAASSSLPLNRRILFALGNTALKRGDYFAAQGYYNRLLDILESQRSRLPVLLPNDRPEYLELAERLMMARNNAGVASEMLAAQTGNRSYHTRALAFYAESNRAWDARTRDPRSMIRSGSTPLPYLNSRNALYPQAGYEPQIFIRIDREALETSNWEDLAPLARLEYDRSN